MIGRTLAHYRVEAKLGEGGMGVVYKATDTHLDRPVAIKVLRPDLVADPERKRRFIREAKSASALNHPNIVTIHDISTAEGADFIVMEYIKGRSLDHLIGRKGLTLSETLKYSTQIADALARAHSIGLIHRDLKPANLMVTEDGLVKVVDFGLAKLSEHNADDAATVTLDPAPQTEEGTIVGTIVYMSPEQAEAKNVDARSDIFSFGSVLYEMVTGRRPFQGDTRLSTLTAITRDEPQPLSEIAEGVPHDLAKIIHRCLRKDPARRFQHMEDLKVALQELKEESESGALAAAQRGREEPRKRRRWALPAAVGLAVLLIVAGAAWRSLRPSPASESTPRIVPVTSFAGEEIQPALSPDGNQVAFAWKGENQDNWDIYVKLIDGGTPLRLTTEAADECCPAWAPDGRRLAFFRQSNNSAAVYVVPALGGPERRIGEEPATAAAGSGPVSTPGRGYKISWSPDGKFIAVAQFARALPGQPSGIFLLSTETGEKRRLTSTPEGYARDFLPAFSPDGRTLAFARSHSGATSALYLLPLTPADALAGEPRRVTAENFSISGLDWTPDGRSLIFSGGPAGGRSRLWRVSTQGGPADPQRLALEGDSVDWPSVSRAGTAGAYRLAYVASSFDTNIWRVPGPAVSAKDAAARAGSALQLIASTRPNHEPHISTDGKRIAFTSDRSGSREVWICENDGSRPVQLTSFGGPQVGSPRWSPDGQRIVFDAYLDGQSDVYVVSAEGGAPRRLTSEKSNEIRPSWSRDGRWIYFGSNRTGTNQIWKMPAEGGAAVQLTRNGGSEAYESADGKFVYYAKGLPPGIFRMPAGGGEEVQVLEHIRVGRWAITRTGVYHLRSGTPSDAPGIDYYSFDRGKLTEIVRFSKQAVVGCPGCTSLAAALDDRWIVYMQRDRVESDIMLMENFR
jgi:Tol biopolymer transport system component/serine/threonine protein kinase